MTYHATDQSATLPSWGTLYTLLGSEYWLIGYLHGPLVRMKLYRTHSHPPTPSEWHNLHELPSYEAYSSCDFSSATQLASAAPNPNGVSVDVSGPGDRYFSCSKICASHGHKVHVCVASTVAEGVCECNEPMPTQRPSVDPTSSRPSFVPTLPLPTSIPTATPTPTATPAPTSFPSTPQPTRYPTTSLPTMRPSPIPSGPSRATHARSNSALATPEIVGLAAAAGLALISAKRCCRHRRRAAVDPAVTESTNSKRRGVTATGVPSAGNPQLSSERGRCLIEVVV